MLLRNTEGSHRAVPTSCKVCIELPWASPMHSVAPAPGFDVVTSPVENGAVWILATASEESINHRPPRVSTITTAANQKIKGVS